MLYYKHFNMLKKLLALCHIPDKVFESVRQNFYNRFNLIFVLSNDVFKVNFFDISVTAQKLD